MNGRCLEITLGTFVWFGLNHGVSIGNQVVAQNDRDC